MRIVETGRPDRLEMRDGGGCAVLLGIPFMGAGVFALALSVDLIPVNNDIPWFWGVPIGLLFATIGAVLTFGRVGCIVDPRARRLTKWWGLLTPMRRRERSLDDFSAVTLTREIRRSNKSTYTVYPVRLRGTDDCSDEKLDEGCQRYEQSRKLAEEVASLLGVDLVDSSTGDAVVRNAEHLDESLPEQILRTGDLGDLPDPPAGAKSVIRQRGKDIIIEIPAPGFGPEHAGGLLFMAVFVGGTTTMLTFILRDDPPLVVTIAATLFLGIFFILLPLVLIGGGVLQHASGLTCLTVDPERGLVLETKSIFGRSRKEMAGKDLEDLNTGRSATGPGSRGKGIVARSDTQTLTFGGHLSDAEREFLCAVIRYTLVS